MTKHPTAEPRGESGRIASIDLLRGFALFGVFMVNVQYMAMNTPSVENPPEGLSLDALTALLVDALFELKFVAIFSFLFGAGMVLQMARADAAGRPFPLPYLRRLTVLFAIGALHGCVLWFGDILLPYAVIGVALLVFHRASGKVLLWIGGGLALLAALQMFPFALLEIIGADRPPAVEVEAEIPSGVGGLLVEFLKGDDARTAYIERVVNVEGPPGRLVALRTAEYVLWLVFSTVIGFNTRVLAAFFVGAAAMKWGFFRSERAGLHRKLCGWGLGVGLPLELGLACAARWSDTAAVLTLPLHFLTSLILSAGYVGAVLLFAASGFARPLARGLACVGRMSLTNYLAQSLVGTLAFSYVGLALFDEFSRPRQVLLVCAVFVGQMAFSVIWLNAMRLGPFEWFWRSLSHGKPQPLLRRR